MKDEPEQAGDIANARLENLKNNSSEPADDGQPQHGGAREGAGRPKGSENEDTKRRRLASSLFKDRVAKHANKLFNAQLDKAVGEKFLFVKRTINAGKKNERTETEIVTDPEIIKQYLDDELNQQGDDDFYFISTKGADNYAIESLLNRAFGTAVKAVDLTSNGESVLGSMNDTELKRIASATAEALADDTASE